LSETTEHARRTVMNDKELIAALNAMLEQEHACAIRYNTHAAVISGPYSETVAARLREIATDEQLHAEKLRARVLALGGTPSMGVSVADLKPARTLDTILKVNIAEENAAIEGYVRILEVVPISNVILFQTLQELVRDEQEHLEELEALRAQPPAGAAGARKKSDRKGRRR
jgi:bacterioferritin (cytochrome b1)